MIGLLNKFIDLIFENSCLICSESSRQNLICKICESNFTIRNNNLKSFEEINVYSWGLYDGRLREGIIALKAGKKKLGCYFAKQLADFWETLPKKVKNKNYLIMPIPSHKHRVKERGYCQTTLIAKEFSQATGLDFSENLIKRKKQTKFMNSLRNLEERRENIKDAFEIVNPVHVKNILIIDDILTSGSTLCEITRTIHKHNPSINILGLTVAAGDRYSV